MAKINEQRLVIKLSQLVRDNDEATDILSDENLSLLLEALTSMVGESVLIEMEYLAVFDEQLQYSYLIPG